jgi:hypothetical protein
MQVSTGPGTFAYDGAWRALKYYEATDYPPEISESIRPPVLTVTNGKKILVLRARFGLFRLVSVKSPCVFCPTIFQHCTAVESPRTFFSAIRN